MNSTMRNHTTNKELSFDLRPQQVGPRAEKRHKTCLELAKVWAEVENDEREKQLNERRNYESTTNEAQKFAKSQISRLSCIDIGHDIAACALTSNGGDVKQCLLATKENEVYKEEAITHWSVKLSNGAPDFPLTTVLSSAKPFARSSAFTNDIRDSKLRHSEGVDFYTGNVNGVAE